MPAGAVARTLNKLAESQWNLRIGRLDTALKAKATSNFMIRVSIRNDSVSAMHRA